MQPKCFTIWVTGEALTPHIYEKWGIARPSNIIPHKQQNIFNLNNRHIVSVIGLMQLCRSVQWCVGVIVIFPVQVKWVSHTHKCI